MPSKTSASTYYTKPADENMSAWATFTEDFYATTRGGGSSKPKKPVIEPRRPKKKTDKHSCGTQTGSHGADADAHGPVLKHGQPLYPCIFAKEGCPRRLTKPGRMCVYCVSPRTDHRVRPGVEGESSRANAEARFEGA